MAVCRWQAVMDDIKSSALRRWTGRLNKLVYEAVKAGAEKARAAYYRKIKKITQDAAYRKKLERQAPAHHYAFE